MTKDQLPNALREALDAEYAGLPLADTGRLTTRWVRADRARVMAAALRWALFYAYEEDLLAAIDLLGKEMESS